MSRYRRSLPTWFPYVDLAYAAAAGALWYAFPQWGAWLLPLALAPWVARFILAGWFTRRTAFDLPLLLFLLTAGIAVWSAPDRSLAWPKFWWIVGGIVLFYALSNAEDLVKAGAAIDPRAWLLAFFGAGVALYFLVTHDWDVYPAKIEALTRLGRALQAPLPVLPGHRLHPNVAGGIMAMMAPYAVWVLARSWRLRRPVLAIGSGGLLALTLFALLMTTSRGAWLALGVAAVLAVLWSASGWLSRGSSRRRAWLFPALVVGGLILALGVALTWPGGLSGLVQSLPGPYPGVGRADLMRNALTLVGDYLLLGSGLGNYMMVYSTYVLLLHVGFTVHSHNLFLNIVVEQGFLGLLALVWMWLLFVLALWRGLLRPEPRAPGPGPAEDAADSEVASGVLGAAALSLVVVVVHGMVDDVLYGSRGVLLLFIPLAFAVPFVPRLARSLVVVVPVALIVVLGLALVWRGPIVSQILANLGAVHQTQTELSTYSWPEWPIQDAVRREVDLSQPRAEYERALGYDAGNATANRRLGQIELSLGEYEKALAHLEAAYAAEPHSVTTRQLLGEALVANGRFEEGRALWAAASNDRGQLNARVYWYEQIGEEERAGWLRQAIEDK